MADTKEDPFDWEIDRVIQELCTANRSWVPAPRAQLPDPDQLAVKIREADYDGQVLLISLDDEADLWSDLGITATRFKQSIRTAIRQFRSRSRGFQEYEQSIREGVSAVAEANKPSDSSPSTTNSLTHQLANDCGNTLRGVQDGMRSLQGESHSDEPPKKKARRLDTLQLVTTERPAHSAILRAIPTEADMVTSLSELQQSTRKTEVSANGSQEFTSSLEKLLSKPGAFWGEGKLASDDILDFDQEAMDDSADFSWSQPWRFGSGRKALVNSRMKRYLGKRSQPDTNDDTDTLPLYGESSEDFFDPDQDAIDREIQEEEDEIRREKEMLQKTDMPPDAVDACLTKMRDEHTTNWRETKLPGLQRKAYGMWTNARKRRNRRSQIMELHSALQSLQQRLDSVLNSLKENVYSKETELLRMGPVLEPPIYEIEKMKWSIEILTSSTAPAKVSHPRRAESAPKKPKLEQQDNGFDIWSEESDGLDEFIVDDSPTFLDQDDSVVGAEKATTTGRVVDVRNEAPVDSDIGQSFASASDDVMIHDLTGSVADVVESSTMPEPRHTPKDTSNQIRLEDLQEIVNKGTEHWERLYDGPRLVLTMIKNWSYKRKEKTLGPFLHSDYSEQVWDEVIAPALSAQSDPDASKSQDSTSRARRDMELAVRLANLFDIYTECGPLTADRKRLKKLDPDTVTRVGQRKSKFDKFWCCLREVAPWFLESGEGSDIEAGGSNGQDADLTPAQQKERRQAQASRIQKYSAQQTQAQNTRRLLLRQGLQNSATISTEKRRLIINESKLESQGLVFVNEDIAAKIKDHQIEGVRFMWDQITRNTGCLLAHTMGLGKTMQVITLLTAIAEAAKSEDKSISEQIPEHLRNLTTLVLCPAGILNNWIDELWAWTSKDVLGTICSINANTPVPQRYKVVNNWVATGGVLVMGYGLLSGMEGKNNDLLKLVLESPSLVVGDEAHYLKNANSKRSQIAFQFPTTSKIALTGSPLANKVDEYYQMISWVAPGFLGKQEDFTSKYATPIKHGLWKDSSAEDRRRARILLVALKKRVADKVHRRTVGVLKESLPPKKEFILYLDLADLQKKAYQTYMLAVLDTKDDIRQTTVWGMISALGELLAHPSILRKKLAKKQAERGESAPTKPSTKKVEEVVLEESADVISNVLEVFGPGHYSDTVKESYKMLVLDKILEEAMKLGENVLVFSHSLLTLDYVEWNLCKSKQRACKRLDGNVSVASRQDMVKRFNENKSQAFLISTTAGGVGLNIYGANRVVILDYKYNPVDEQQAIGRAYRIGQTKEVVVYWLMCDGTFERTLHQHQVFKTQLAARVVDEKHPLPKASLDLLDWVKTLQPVSHQDKSGHRGKDPILDSLLDTQAICSGIISIDTTETFEEEELDKDLSATDQIEADRLAAEQDPPENVAVAAYAAQPILSGQQPTAQVQQNPPVLASGLVNPGSRPGQNAVSTSAGLPDWFRVPNIWAPNMLPSASSSNAHVLGGATPGSFGQSVALHPWSLGAGTNVGAQPYSPHLPVGFQVGPHQSTDPAAPMAVDGTSDTQRSNTMSKQEAPRPIMMNATPRSSTPSLRDRLQRKLAEMWPSVPDRVEQVLTDLDGLPGGSLFKNKMFANLLWTIGRHAICAMALFDGRIQAQDLTKAGTLSRDKFEELLLGMSRDRDPDV